MTSEIAAPAAGGVDGAEGLLTDGDAALPEDVWVPPDWLLTVCEHPATSPAARKHTTISVAIRIPPG